MFKRCLSYKPPSSWRILFRSGGRPTKFSFLKNFRALVVPGGGFRKLIILQVVQLKFSLSCDRGGLFRRKGDVSGSSVHVSRPINSPYIQIFRRSIYNTRRPGHPHLPIFLITTTPRGPCFTYPLEVCIKITIH